MTHRTRDGNGISDRQRKRRWAQEHKNQPTTANANNCQHQPTYPPSPRRCTSLHLLVLEVAPDPPFPSLRTPPREPAAHAVDTASPVAASSKHSRAAWRHCFSTPVCLSRKDSRRPLSASLRAGWVLPMACCLVAVFGFCCIQAYAHGTPCCGQPSLKKVTLALPAFAPPLVRYRFHARTCIGSSRPRRIQAASSGDKMKEAFCRKQETTKRHEGNNKQQNDMKERKR